MFIAQVFDENDDMHEAVVNYELLSNRRHRITGITCPIKLGQRQLDNVELALAKSLLWGDEEYE